MKLPPPYKAPFDDSNENEEECAFINSEFLYIIRSGWVQNLLNCALVIVVHYQMQSCGLLENMHEYIILKEKIYLRLNLCDFILLSFPL